MSAFHLLTENDVHSVLTMDDLIETMASALARFSSRTVEQPVRTAIPIAENAFFWTMPAFARRRSHGSIPGAADRSSHQDETRSAAGDGAALGTKLVTLYESNIARGLPSHLASIILLDPETGALKAILDGRYITEARTAAVSAVSSRLLARRTSKSLAIIGSGVQARSHLEALSRVHALSQVAVWSPNKIHRDQFIAEMKSAGTGTKLAAAEHAGEAVVGADIIVLVTSSPTPVLESGWVKPGAHVIGVGACRPNQREIDPDLMARARLFVDSREAALVESGDVVMGIAERRFGPEHIVAELGEVVAGATGRRNDSEITVFKSLGMAIEDVMAADLAYRRAREKGIGLELTL
jgi:ornithine cyclodeaminase/alanine dehydrogenase-like protein (mu-crystallin family)